MWLLLLQFVPEVLVGRSVPEVLALLGFPVGLEGLSVLEGLFLPELPEVLAHLEYLVGLEGPEVQEGLQVQECLDPMRVLCLFLFS